MENAQFALLSDEHHFFGRSQIGQLSNPPLVTTSSVTCPVVLGTKLGTHLIIQPCASKHLTKGGKKESGQYWRALKKINFVVEKRGYFSVRLIQVTSEQGQYSQSNPEPFPCLLGHAKETSYH